MMGIRVLTLMGSISPFFRRFWPFLRDKIGTTFDQFHQFSSLPHGFSSFFVTLIPMIDSPSRLGDFWPISLLGSFYKFLAKKNVGRLSGATDKLISPNQSTFLECRLLVDGVFAMNELVDLAKKSKKSCFIFKVDFEKAFDSVSWYFLDNMHSYFGFNDKWKG